MEMFSYSVLPIILENVYIDNLFYNFDFDFETLWILLSLIKTNSWRIFCIYSHQFDLFVFLIILYRMLRKTKEYTFKYKQIYFLI